MPASTLSTIIVIALCLIFASQLQAGGISADAGLTPAQDKWIFRAQARHTKLGPDTTRFKHTKEMHMYSLVIAYGLRSDLTLMARQPFMKREMTLVQDGKEYYGSSSGFADLMLMAKYRAVRRNTPTYTLGIAPLLAVTLPTGEEHHTADALALKTGLYVSARRVPWATDLNITYTLNGLIGDDDRKESTLFELVGALAHQISLTDDGRIAVAPVVEFAYEHASSTEIEGVAQPKTGGSIYKLAPGMKLTISSVIFESLVWIPLWEDLNGNQLEYDIGALFGVRVML
jgi:hypothetical protein